MTRGNERPEEAVGRGSRNSVTPHRHDVAMTSFVIVLAALVVLAAMVALCAVMMAGVRRQAAETAAQRTAESNAALEQLRASSAGALEQLRGAAAADRQQMLDALVRTQRELAEMTVQQQEATMRAQSAALNQELGAKRDVIDSRLTQVETAMQEGLVAVGRAVSELQRTSAERFGSLDQALTMHADATRSLTTTTNTLREALANPKARGQWGERMAEDVLRLAGFREGFNYVKQTSVAEGAGIPDFTFTLPKGHKLFLDVKFPLTSYLAYLNADTDGERSTHRAQFLRDVRVRVRELAQRKYDHDPASLDYVLLFVPNESISGFMHEVDATLIDEALRQRVVLCSPLTLFALLAVVRQAHDAFLTEQRADEIQKQMAKFSKQWTMFTDQLDKVQRQLTGAVKSYEDLNGTRRRQLERPLEKIEALRSRSIDAETSDLEAGHDGDPYEGDRGDAPARIGRRRGADVLPFEPARELPA
jgi:DNA recombination protein RmuC